MEYQVERYNSKFHRVPRSSRACVSCHQRKVRCDISANKRSCVDCERLGQPCRPWARRRTNPLAKPPSSVAWESSSHQEKSGLTIQRSADASATPPTHHDDSQDHVELQTWQHNDQNVQQPPGITDLSPMLDAAASSISSTYDGYMERSTYIAPDAYRAEDGAPTENDDHAPVVHNAADEISTTICSLQKALSLPPRSIRESLYDNFWTFCYPWEPILDKTQIMSMPAEQVPPILLQAVFLAGSRMSSASFSYATPQDYYNRAKCLFYLDQAQDKPLLLLIAVSLLHWWNPHGPERVSTNTSSFWIRIAVGLAQQMGFHSRKRAVPDESLRRRIWWSLVARDCTIAAAHGRPQAINIDDCDLPRPTIDDFPQSPSTGMLFIAYVDLCLIIGRFVKNMRHAQSSSSEIESSLCLWIKALPDSLRLSPSQQDSLPKPYNFLARQLNVMYLLAIILIHRSRSLQGPFPSTAVLAASTMAGIFEDFLARDEVRYLSPVFTFYLLAAAISLLSCFKYPSLWAIAQEDLRSIRQAQDEMRKKWPSAAGSTNTFERMYKLTITTQKQVDKRPNNMSTPEQAVFFKDMDMALCRMWDPIFVEGSKKPVPDPSLDVTNTTQKQFLDFLPLEATATDVDIGQTAFQAANMPSLYSSHLTENMDFDGLFGDHGGQLNDGFGDWLFSDQQTFDGL